MDRGLVAAAAAGKARTTAVGWRYDELPACADPTGGHTAQLDQESELKAGQEEADSLNESDQARKT